MNNSEPSIIIAVNRFCEGFDDPRVDTCIYLDAVKSRSRIKFIQSSGRSLRKYEGKTCGNIMDCFSFNNDESKIKQISNMIIEYYLSLKHLDASNTDNDDNFDFLINNIRIDPNIQTVYLNNCISINVNSQSISSIEWHDLPKVIEAKLIEMFKSNKMTYKDAKQFIQCLKNKIIGKRDYFERCDSYHLPLDPNEHFGKSFNSWCDYLSIECDYYDLDECRDVIRQYLEDNRKLKRCRNNYNKMIVMLAELDNKFPPCDLWIDYYKQFDVKIESLDKILDEVFTTKQEQKKINVDDDYNPFLKLF